MQSGEIQGHMYMRPGQGPTNQPAMLITHPYRAFSEAEKARIADDLNQPMDVNQIQMRPGPGGKSMSYMPVEKAIQSTNEIFSFCGWSSTVTSLTINYEDRNAEGKWEVSATAAVRVTLSDGTYHEDVGAGKAFGSRSDAHEKSRKSASSDALKRALRLFGSHLGGDIKIKSSTKKPAAAAQKPKPPPPQNSSGGGPSNNNSASSKPPYNNNQNNNIQHKNNTGSGGNQSYGNQIQNSNLNNNVKGGVNQGMQGGGLQQRQPYPPQGSMVNENVANGGANYANKGIGNSMNNNTATNTNTSMQNNGYAPKPCNDGLFNNFNATPIQKQAPPARPYVQPQGSSTATTGGGPSASKQPPYTNTNMNNGGNTNNMYNNVRTNTNTNVQSTNSTPQHQQQQQRGLHNPQQQPRTTANPTSGPTASSSSVSGNTSNVNTNTNTSTVPPAVYAQQSNTTLENMVQSASILYGTPSPILQPPPPKAPIAPPPTSHMHCSGAGYIVEEEVFSQLDLDDKAAEMMAAYDIKAKEAVIKSDSQGQAPASNNTSQNVACAPAPARPYVNCGPSRNGSYNDATGAKRQCL